MISIVNDQRVARVSELIPMLGLKAVPNINVLIMNDFAVLELNKTSMMIVELGLINITPGTPINGDLAYCYNSCSPEQPTMCSHDTLLEMHLKNIYQKYSYDINGGGAKLVAAKQNIISTGDFNDFMQMKSKDGCRFYRMMGLNMNKIYMIPYFSGFPSLTSKDDLSISVFDIGNKQLVISESIYKKKLNHSITMIFRSLDIS